MKKLVFLFAAIIFSATSFAQDIGLPNITNPSPLEGVKGGKSIHIEFGRRSRNCTGFGICFFIIDLSVEDLINIVKAFQRQSGQLQVVFPPKMIKDNSKFFANNKLVVEEDLVLDSATARALGYSSYTIKKGTYDVILNKSSNTYNCTF